MNGCGWVGDTMVEPQNDDPLDSTRMSVGEHFDELRWRLLKALLGLVVGFVVCLALGNRLVMFINAPVEEALRQYEENIKAEAAASQPAQPVRIVLRREADEAQLAAAEQLAKQLPGLVKVDRDAGTVWLEAELETVHVQGQREPDKARITSLGPAEAFGVYLKVSLIAGLVLTSPYVFYQIWSFVAAGLFPRERRFAYTLLPLAVGLFMGGAVFCYFVVFPQVLSFLMWFNQWMNIRPQIRISDWLGFALTLPLVFGLAFQLPLVMLMLDRVGLVHVGTFRSKRRHAILICFVVAMLLTPPDPMSQIMMAVPLVALYELGLVLIRLRGGPADDEHDSDLPPAG